MSIKNNSSYKTFNKKLYFESFRQLKLIGLIATFIMVLIAVLLPISQYINIDAYSAFPITITILRNFFFLIASYTIIAPVLTLTAFSFLTKRMTCDYYHSFPQTRRCLFLTLFAAVISWVLITIFVPTLLSMAQSQILWDKGFLT